MAEDDELNLDDGGSDSVESAPKKKSSGFKALLPNILKFTAIGLGAAIFIITVSVITVNVVNKGGGAKNPTADPTDPYVASPPEYANYTLIGPVTTATKDSQPKFSVTVDIVLEYTLNDAIAQTELTSSQYKLKDFVRHYFAQKYAADLAPEQELRLKNDIKEILNTRVLSRARIHGVLFNKLDVMEAF